MAPTTTRSASGPASPSAGSGAGSLGDRRPARERLLAAADELFYGEGVHTVGIDRVIERAGVAKATLYSSFGSKDGLIREYLLRRHEARKNRMLEGLASCDGPRERLLGVFDVLGQWTTRPDFRGCPFANASAEARPGGTVEEVADMARAWIRSLFVELAEAVGAAEPEVLARELQMLYDGATVAARMDRDPQAAVRARATAALLVDAATG